MEGLFLIILIVLFAATSSFVSSVGKLTDFRKKRLRVVTLRGWIMISLNLGIIVFSVIQYLQNQSELKKNDAIAIVKQLKRDSTLKENYDSSLIVLKSKFDTSNIRTISTITEILGKYGFKLDSTNKRLVRIITDSAKTKIILQDPPVLELCREYGIKLLEHKNGRYHFKLSICSYDASSTSFNCLFYYVLEDSAKNMTLLQGETFLSKAQKIAKDEELGSFFDISDTHLFTFLYIVIIGTYKNMDETKEYQVNEVYYFNKKGNTFGSITGQTKERIENFIKKNK